MKITLRDYQTRTLDAIDRAEKDGVRRPLVVHPTGTGKTVTLGAMIANRADRGRSLVLVHRDELAGQTIEKLGWQAPNLSTGLVKAGSDDVHADVVVASVQTVSRDARLARLISSQEGHGRFGTIVVDEAHHAPAPTWTKVLDGLGAFQPYGPLTVGFTATPERDNGKTLGVWEKVVDFMSIREAIYGGYLVPILPAVVVETNMDLDRVRKSRGDYSDGDLGKAIESSGAIDQVADAYVAHASDRKAVAFTPTVVTAQALSEALRDRGVKAAVVHGATPPDNRKEILSWLRTGKIQVVVNCAVLTEGFDEPSISCVIVARPTRFHGLYVQMVGRGTRLFPGKKDLLVIDVVGASQRHELIGVVDLGLDMDGESERRTPGDKQTCPSCGQVSCQIMSHRCALCHRYLPVSTVSAGRTRHDNCRAGAGGQVDVFGTSRLQWLPIGAGWCLGAGEEIVIMLPAREDTWTVASYRSGDLNILHDALPSDWAMNIGEERAKAFLSLTARSARWRKGAVSEAQRTRLVREGLPPEHLDKVRTRGEAADLITRIQARRAVRRMAR